MSSVKASPSPQVNPELIELKKQARAYQEDMLVLSSLSL